MVPLPKPPKIIEKKENFARFEIEALYPGYGATVGNTLRRVLLSSLPGAAITQLKIKGVQHEFSTISGVLEDVVEIILNLKQLRFKIYSPDPQRARLLIKGGKEVKGADFDLPAQVEIVNKDAHVATLTNKKAELEMEILIEKGLGYEPVERRKKEKLEIGMIPLDAIFTPIRKINYHVENMRVGERTDFDRLIFEIETDGTLTPEEAMSDASEILVKYFSLFSETFKKEQGPMPPEKKKIEKDLIKIPIENLKFSKRTLNLLLKNNIKTVGGILKKKKEDLLKIEGMGEKGVREIKKVLKKINLTLKE